ncbi:MAG: cobyric acid synthase [Pseudomonadota bacterium]
MGKSIMIQGAGSNVGKSVIVAGLCRAARNRGISVAPFKPQNMSNNAMVTEDGGEIGRAQALQARASGLEPRIDMNPVLLKPEGEQGSQVIVQGARVATVQAKDYGGWKPKLLPKVLESFARLTSEFDLVIVEGAGSPAEINLREGDIANMGFAEAADVPVVVIGDIDRGGVIAQLVGTQSVLSEPDARRIKAFMVNKFRGDVRLFDRGLDEIASRTGWAPIGVVPWFGSARHLPAEDSLDLSERRRDGQLKIAVPRFPRIANFDDLDPLSAEPSVDLVMLEAGDVIPTDTELVILPGSKSTLSDLDWFVAQGFDIDLRAHIRRGGRVLGLCGGYQMLGKTVSDLEGLEGPARTADGLGVLDVSTVMSPEKTLTKISGVSIYIGTADVSGYEIHLGQTDGADASRPFLSIDGKPAGAVSRNGQVMGCYIHGVFGSDAFRRDYLNWLGAAPSDLRYEELLEDTLDDLAAHLETCLDIDQLFLLAG